MTAAFRVSLASISPDFGTARAATALRGMLDDVSGSDASQRYFGGVDRALQHNREISGRADLEVKFSALPVLVPPRKRYRMDSAFAHIPQLMGNSLNIVNKPALSFASSDTSHHGGASLGLTICASATFIPGKSATYPRADTGRTDPGDKPFILLQRARRLLSAQRIREARRVLQLGAVSFPEDKKIGELLQAVTPGRTKMVRCTMPDRKQEMNWIQRNGHRHRGLWVAVSGGGLVTSARTLEALLAEVKRTGNEHGTPIVQHIAAE